MKKGNLLLVDDEDLILQALVFSLSSYADKIFTALNGEEALEILKKETINVVVSDIQMPKMNGIELIKTVREMDNNVPFIFFTGHGDRLLVNEAVKYGAFEFIDKPNLENIEEVVNSAFVYAQNGSSFEEWKSEDELSDFQKLLLKKLDQ